jgi:hypothetical protein
MIFIGPGNVGQERISLAKISTHEEDCRRLIGSPHTEVHEWLDEYAKKYNPRVFLERHRQYRHNEQALLEKFKEWGFYQILAAKIHIVRDYEIYCCTEPFDYIEIEEIDDLFHRALQYLPKAPPKTY